MKLLLYSWAIIFISIITLDLIWFRVMSERFYMTHLQYIISRNFNYIIASIFYIVYSFALSYLVIIPNVQLNNAVFYVSVSGFVMGVSSYSAYNLTNQATITNWPILVTLVDTCWGGVITSFSTSFCYFIIRSVKNCC